MRRRAPFKTILRALGAVSLAAASTAVVSRTASAGEAAEDEPSPAALLFGKRCGGCHTIGGGDRVGPDLLGVTGRRSSDWLRTFIKTPGAVIDRGDPAATELLARFKGVRMPDQSVSDAELAGLLEHLADCTQKGGCKIATGKSRPVSEAKADDVALGRALVTGARALSGGGPACISCHHVRDVGPLGGGTLAKDLTFAYARLGEAGLTSALETTPFPLMKDVFASKALTPAEVFAIKAYLAEASKDGTPPRPDHDFLYLGVLGLVGAFGTFGFVWSGRNQRTRRETLSAKGRA